MNKKIFNIIVLVLLSTITLYIVFTSKELIALPELLNRTNTIYLLMAFGLMIIYILLNALIILIIGRNISPVFDFRKSFFLSLIGQYYSLITPFATGGQPAQVYVMKNKYNINYIKGTTITIKKFIIYQVVVSFYGLFLFLCRFNMILIHQSEMVFFIIIGLLSNGLGSIIILLLAYNDSIIKKILNKILSFMNRYKLFRRYDNNKLFKHIDEYTENIKEIKNNKMMMIKLIIITFIQLTVYFSITYMIYLSLGYSKANYIDILSIQIILYLVVSYIPTPGGVGASESGFYIMFGMFFPKEVLLYAMILWRVIIYYANLIFSGIVILIDSIFEKYLKRSLF